jgi:hypothetical protein
MSEPQWRYKYDEETRKKIAGIVERLQTDAAFKDQITADPSSALDSAGLPADAVRDIVNLAGDDGDVVGYMRADRSISGCKCWVDGRPDTCYD